jgi:hypothetical protein
MKLVIKELNSIFIKYEDGFSDCQCEALASALVSFYPKPFQQQTLFAVELF